MHTTCQYIQIHAFFWYGVLAALGGTAVTAQTYVDSAPHPPTALDVTTVDQRRELFVDDHMIHEIDNASLKLHSPQPAGAAIRFDQPWEGAFSGYATIIHDQNFYRMYYRGLPEAGQDGTNREVTCCATSVDGIHWTKPNLGIYEYGGSKNNNIVLMNEKPLCHNFAPFLDKNPDSKHSERFKAIAGTQNSGLVAFVSEDGFRWKKLQQEPVFRDGIFDSQNVAFWSEHEQQYVCFFRTWTGGEYAGFRTISRTTSTDFVNWSEPESMNFGDTPSEHLYTNQTTPYFRAPQIYLGLAARFMPGRKVISDRDADLIGVVKRYSNDCSDIVLLSSRGEAAYDRTFMESLIRPGLGQENWVSRSNYAARGIVPTSPTEISIYLGKNYGQPTAYMERYQLRTDGFSSLHAGYEGGEMTTTLLQINPPNSEQAKQHKMRWLEQNRDAFAYPSISTETPLVGRQSLRIEKPMTITLPNTENLGQEFTLAAHVKSVPGGHRRLFSAYQGGNVESNELIIDFNSAGTIENDEALRFLLGDLKMTIDSSILGDWSRESGDINRHHIAVTVGQGKAKIFFDGRVVGECPYELKKPLRLKTGALRFGEDFSPTSLKNEAFLGEVDDILFIRRALSEDAIQQLSQQGFTALISDTDAAGSALDFEFDLPAHEFHSEMLFKNRLGSPAVFAPKIDFGLRRLSLNCSTSAAGSVRVEILNQDGSPIPGYQMEHCDEIIGDQIQKTVTWRGKSDLIDITNQPFRLRFQLRDADIYSWEIF